MPIAPDIQAKFNALHADLAGEWAKIRTQFAAGGWFHIHADTLSAGWQFLVAAVQQLAALADSSGLLNADKKAIVLEYAKKLFEIVIAAEVPLPLQPLVLSLGPVFLSALSGIIEYVVAILHNKPPVPTPVPPAPVTP